jgi:hypothetical protein
MQLVLGAMKDISILDPNLDRLIRYGYSGFLLVGILLFLVPNRVAPVIEAGGAVITPLAILAAGAAIYTLYRYVLNELILSPFVIHPIHSLLDRGRPSTNPANCLADYRVPAHLRHSAYGELRRGFFKPKQTRSFDRNHTEATVVWLTGVECTVMGAVLFLAPTVGVPAWKSWMLVAAGVMALIAAVILDIRLFRQECRILRANAARLPEFLESRGLSRP